MDVLVRNGDNWVRREAHTANDSLPLSLIESRGSEYLEELLSVAVLNLGGKLVVRSTVMGYFPEAYIGGDVLYTETGEPETAGLVVVPDFNPTQLNAPAKRVTRNYGGKNDGVCGDGDRERIRFPACWAEQADQVTFEVDVRTTEGEWVRRSLTFPAHLTVEILKNCGRKKLTGMSEPFMIASNEKP